MANPNSSRAQWNELYTATYDTLINAGKPEIPLFNGDPTLEKFLAGGMKVEKQGGPVVRANIIYADSTRGQWVRGLETLTLGEDDAETTCSIEWSKYVDPVTVSEDTLEENAGDGRIDDLVTTKLARSMSSIRNQVSQALYATSQNPLKILSLIQIITSGSTIGGIPKSTTSFNWNGNSNGDAAQLSDSMLTDMYLSCTFDNVSPDLMPCSLNMFKRIWQIYADKIHIINSVTAGNIGSNPAKGIPFGDGMFFMDKNCPAGNVFFLASPKLKFVVHRDVFFNKKGPFESGEVLGITYRHALKCCLIPLSIRNLGRLFGKTV